MVNDLRDNLATLELGKARVERQAGQDRLFRPPTTARVYADAELAEYRARRPPVRLAVRACFSHPADQIRGTAGFGFWNAAIGPGTGRIRLPRAVWFFAAGPPYDVPLALDVPGRGFKAATLDALRPGFLALLPTAPLGVLAMRNDWLYRRLWPVAQRALGASERDLSHLDLTVPHDYALSWESNRVTFEVDRETVLVSPTAPGGPLHFVIWIDNAYAIATPRGRFGIGTLDIDQPQWLDVESIRIE